MTKRLDNYFAGRWQTGSGKGAALYNPVTGDELVRIDNQGTDLEEGFAFARKQGGQALRAMTYQQRGQMLGEVVKVLRSHRADYYDISAANSGTVKNDSAVDIEGGIFT
ncbi:MAG: aldehyde dehydrogenase family protein, partial [Thiolinea sp.]